MVEPTNFTSTGLFPAVDSSTELAGQAHQQQHEWLNVNVLLTFVYLVIFIIGVIGNVCNCLVIADSRNRYMKTATNYYLFSLSVSDLLLLIFGLPHDLINLWHPSPYLFNQFVCISRGWISEASTYASVLVIVTFTVERYLAICHPLKAHTFSRLSRAIKIIVIIWLVASTCALVVVMQYGLITVAERQPDGHDTSTTQCTTVQRNEIIFELRVLIFFIIPMAVISILYIKLGYHLRRKSYLIKQNQLRKQERLTTGMATGSSKSALASPRPSCVSQSSLVVANDMPISKPARPTWRLWPSGTHAARPTSNLEHSSEAHLAPPARGHRLSRSADQVGALGPGELDECAGSNGSPRNDGKCIR